MVVVVMAAVVMVVGVNTVPLRWNHLLVVVVFGLGFAVETHGWRVGLHRSEGTRCENSVYGYVV